ncbi:DUF6779 domain-containing protein [Prauserella shujinwangii]|nr:DUF6779 domain-containing protein [Prauserella shujinwangii]
MTGVDDDSRGRHSGRSWLVVGFVLAVAATLALVLTEDLRYLRLGIVAALWAALIGAFVAARYRKQVAATQESVAQAQEIYELELEREIAARREFELELEAEAKQRAEENSRDELEALRAEVTALRESLQALFGGEVLYERVALTAQSTRMRSLSEEPRMVTAGENNGNGNGNGKKPAQLLASKKPVELTDRPTELIDRVREPEAPPRRAPQADSGKTQYVPRPSRPVDSGGAQDRQPPRRVRPPGASVAAKASEAANRARAEMSRPRQQPVERPAPDQRDQSPPTRQVKPVQTPPKRQAQSPRERGPEPRRDHPAEPTRPAMEPLTRGRSAASVTPPGREPEHSPKPQRKKPEQSPVQRPEPEQPTPAARRAPQQPEPVPEPAPSYDADWSASWRDAEGGGRRRAPEQAAADEARPEPNPTLPPEIRDLPARPGGRRRRAEDDDAAAGRHGEPESYSGGRRYRPEGEPWANHGGGERANGGGRRRAPEPDSTNEPSGSHSEGRSVSELLAAHGASNTTPRRRRRAED